MRRRPAPWPTAQRLATGTSLAKLAVNESLPAIALWGKIGGSQRDYFVARAVRVGTAVVKSFYFSGDGGVTFSKLPPVDDWLRERCAKIRGPFTGNASRRYKDTRIYTQEEEEDEEAKERELDDAFEEEQEAAAQALRDEKGDDAVVPEKKERKRERRVTEVDRLAYTVEAVEHDCCILPRGAYYLTATGDIVKNDAFRGLSSDDSRKLTSYQLFRAPLDTRTAARIRRAGVANNPDFLDTLETKGEWSLSVDDSGTVVTLRSLVWLGFEFRITAASPSFVSGYFGLGERNLDLAFML